MLTTTDLTPRMQAVLREAAERYAKARAVYTVNGRLAKDPGMEDYCRRLHGVTGHTLKALTERGLIVQIPGPRPGDGPYNTLTDDGLTVAERVYDEVYGEAAFARLVDAKLAEEQAEEDRLAARVADAAARVKALAPVLKGLDPQAPGLGDRPGQDLLAVARERLGGDDARYQDPAIPVTLKTLEAIVARAREGV